MVIVYNLIYITALYIICSEVIITISLPDGQYSVSHPDIIIWILISNPWHEVPWSFFPIYKSGRENCEEPKPISITIRVIWFIICGFFINQGFLSSWITIIEICINWFIRWLWGYLLDQCIISSSKTKYIFRVCKIFACFKCSLSSIKTNVW